MRKRTVPISIPAYVARTQLGSILTQVAEKKARFIITKSGKPTAVLIGATDFDDMLEELDPEFQKSLKVAAKEYDAGKAVSLRDYLKERIAARRAG
ncbi:MAG: type II toxin-antitoxin system Phd/YefM family antitoxin [candidate division NC10 bacterium]|nr:type II toxin-antitoxin system Phd/YefM family antitoxin [candidate division NC10 bacterium]MDE2485460.1 type II toxin-antitoxin system Phd/YefM family antitoxin [candidate division NC10 bacterium]